MSNYVLVGLATRRYALPLSEVIETLRPLPIEPIPGAPPYVRGLSIIRGAPIPMIDLGRLLGAPPHRGGRVVTLRAGQRRIGIEVDVVIGVRPFAAEALEALPPLLRDAGLETVEALGSLDTQLLAVLRAGRLLPEEVWSALGIA